MNFLIALEEVSREKNISTDTLLDAIRDAVTSAYRKKFGQDCNIRVDFEKESGALQVLVQKKVVSPFELYMVPDTLEGAGTHFPLTNGSIIVGRDESCDLTIDDPDISEKHLKLELDTDKLVFVDLESENGTFFNDAKLAEGVIPLDESIMIGESELIFQELDTSRLGREFIELGDARKVNAEIEIGQILETPVDASQFGRIAVKVIKQTVSQNLAEEERESLYDEVFKKEHTIAIGRVQRVEKKRQGTVYLELGRSEVTLLHKAQIPGESFFVGDKVKVYVLEVKRSMKTPMVSVSRSCPEFLTQLFTDEIPEIQEGIVKIKSVAREAGSRTKIAIFSDDSSIDPVGACVGIRGSRIMGIVEELNGEKLDIIKFNTNLKDFIINALSPAKVTEVRFNDEKTVAEVIVPENQISLAIGSGGQNVRLAAKLVNCHLELKTEG